MLLSGGARLGPYEIVGLLGTGGMGEVYRARDTRLGRDVAIKLSAAEFGDRFAREARVVASLNHANICTLHDVGSNYLVMELVEGPTLADRIRGGAVPVSEALPIARQIAEALEAAHDQGIVHRDLKPGNIKLTAASLVKVLDFGLASIPIDSAAGSRDPANSPTLTLSATQPGTILGTAGYMAPEQAKGKRADRRADIWSFGVVFYEMLTGKRAFDGETVSEILAAVIMTQPDLGSLPDETPWVIRALLRRCLTKDPRRRLQSIGEARIAIEDVLSGVVPDAPSAPPAADRPLRRALPWALAAIFAAAFALTFWAWSRPHYEAPRPVIRYSTPLPNAPRITAVRLSRDGSRLAYMGMSRQIYVRELNKLEGRALTGTEGAADPFFSPDGEWIGFILGGKLRKVAVSGGAPIPITDLDASPHRIIWLPDDTIVFSRDDKLMRVPASGGNPTVLAAPDARDSSTLSALDDLPGGGKLLVAHWMNAAEAPVSLFDVRSGRQTNLVETASWARYAPTGIGTGHIVYRAGETLFAAPFDPARDRMTGPPVPVLGAVRRWQATTLIDFSDSGVLAYVPTVADPEVTRTLMWLDRRGNAQPLPAPPGGYTNLKLSPDGSRVAVQVVSPGQGSKISVIDTARGTVTQLTSQGNNVVPVWSPDGKRVAYRSNIGGRDAIVTSPADGSAAPVLLTRENRMGVAFSWSQDGSLLGLDNGSRAFWLIAIRPDGSAGDRRSLLASEAQKGRGAISPDGKWLAYSSNETGRYQIYVGSFPEMKERTTVSLDGGDIPRWRGDGQELFYRNGQKVMAVAIGANGGLRADVPHMLFEGPIGDFDVSSDGKRFLMVEPGPESPLPNTELHVVVNWFDELRRLAPANK